MSYGFEIFNPLGNKTFSTEAVAYFYVTAKGSIPMPLEPNLYSAGYYNPRYAVFTIPWVDYIEPLLFINLPIGGVLASYDRAGGFSTSSTTYYGAGPPYNSAPHAIATLNCLSTDLRYVSVTPLPDAGSASAIITSGQGIRSYKANGDLAFSTDVEIANIVASTSFLTHVMLGEPSVDVIVPPLYADGKLLEPYVCINGLGLNSVYQGVWSYGIQRISENTFRTLTVHMGDDVTAENYFSLRSLYYGSGATKVQFSRFATDII